MRDSSIGDSGLPVKVISGGQTGVDRAALDAARRQGLETGGWCPKGRRAEDGAVPPRYALRETPLRVYAQRTEWNVRDADATLILYRGALTGGTRLTAELAERMGKPLLVVDLGGDPRPRDARAWVSGAGIGVLNIAGPRESAAPGIYADALAFVSRMLAREPVIGPR